MDITMLADKMVELDIIASVSMRPSDDMKYNAQSALRADSWNLTPFLRDRLVGQLRHRCLV